jgi:uncharacterized protein (DUF885 family)
MSKREFTKIDKIADDFFYENLKLSPDNATIMGFPTDFPDAYTDYSPRGVEKVQSLRKSARAKMKGAKPTDFQDELTKTQFISSLDLSITKDETLMDAYRIVSNLESPVQGVIEIFDLLPSKTEIDFEHILIRLSNIGVTINGYISSLEYGFSKGVMPARHQVELCAKYSHSVADKGMLLNDILKKAKNAGVSDKLFKKLESEIARARNV